MRYCAFFCPGCSEAFGAECDAKRVKCPRCNRSLSMANMMPFFRSGSPGDCARAVAELNLRSQAGERADELLEFIARSGKEAEFVRNDPYARLIRHMKEAHEGFATFEQLCETVDFATPEKIRELLECALAEGDLYLDRTDIYRLA